MAGGKTKSAVTKSKDKRSYDRERYTSATSTQASALSSQTSVNSHLNLDVSTLNISLILKTALIKIQ